MVSKRQREQRKNATAASLLWYERQRLETPDNSAVNDCHNDEPSDTDDTDNTDSGATWFWNDSANESQSDSEEEGDCDLGEENDSEIEQSRTNEAMVSKKVELVWKKRGDKNLRGGYGNGSRTTRKRQRNKNKALEKEAAKSYQIGALWERQRVSQAEQAVAATYPLSQVPRGRVSRPKQEIRMEKRKETSEAMDKLLSLVTEQEKKYGLRLSPHSNFYRRYVMVQQFLHSQFTNPTN